MRLRARIRPFALALVPGAALVVPAGHARDHPPPFRILSLVGLPFDG